MRAIISVWDKTGVVELGRALARLGCEIYSTGNTERALRDGAVLPWQKSGGTAQYRMAILEGLSKKYKFGLGDPIKKLPKKAQVQGNRA